MKLKKKKNFKIKNCIFVKKYGLELKFPFFFTGILSLKISKNLTVAIKSNIVLLLLHDKQEIFMFNYLIHQQTYKVT